MSKKQYWNSESKNQSWLKQKRGQGTLSTYKPWFTVSDVASEGRSHRVFGHLTSRTHHLLSDLELATFLLLQWRSVTLDIREQFPLDREITRQICSEIEVKHPSYQGVDQYMSSDFLVDTQEREKSRFAIQVKSSDVLTDKRTVEKLEVERRYWLEKQVPWYLVTENQIPSVVFENINLFYNHIEASSPQDELLIQSEFYSKHVSDNRHLKLVDLCKKLDMAYDHEPGESLYQLKRLLAQRYFHFDICIPFLELRCSNLIAEDSHKLRESLYVSG